MKKQGEPEFGVTYELGLIEVIKCIERIHKTNGCVRKRESSSTLNDTETKKLYLNFKHS